jgi:mycothiol synthase
VSDLDFLVVSQLEPEMAHQVEQLCRRASEVDHYDPLSEHKRIGLAQASRPRAGFAAVLARHRRPDDQLELVGYAQVSSSGKGEDGAPGYGIELVLDPVGRGDGSGLADSLLGLALARADRIASEAGTGPATVRFWVTHATPVHDQLALFHGLRPERDLLQLRVALPLEDPHRGPVLGIRTFRPGSDEAAWLQVNNRAFASHPEQGNWDLDTLLEREREQWFDPDDFLIHEVDGRLAASCWTKVHTTDPPLGEIYVISVDPAFHGQGLGRAMTQAGLDHLAGRGLAVGMLYVDGDNTAAVSLYRSMGFAEHHVDRAYLTETG